MRHFLESLDTYWWGIVIVFLSQCAALGLVLAGLPIEPALFVTVFGLGVMAAGAWGRS